MCWSLRVYILCGILNWPCPAGPGARLPPVLVPLLGSARHSAGEGGQGRAGRAELEGALRLTPRSLCSVVWGRPAAPGEVPRTDETEGGSEGEAGVEASIRRRTSTFVVPIWGSDQGQECICFLMAGEGETTTRVSWEYQLGQGEAGHWG